MSSKEAEASKDNDSKQLKEEPVQSEGSIKKVPQSVEGANVTDEKTLVEEDPLEKPIPLPPIRKRKTDPETDSEQVKKLKSELSPDSETGKEASDSIKSPPPLPEKPKFVFGQKTKFASVGGFGAFTKKNVFGSKPLNEETNTDSEDTKDEPEGNSNPKDESKAESTDKPKPVFGTGSSFGNAFKKSLSKKSVFEDLESKKEQTPEAENNDETEKTEKSVKEKSTPGIPLFAKVQMNIQEQSAEVEQKSLYSVKSKLYRLDLDAIKEGWKEKGVGILKLIDKTDTEFYKLVMRQDATFRSLLNIPLVKGLKIDKGMESSLQSEKFLRITLQEDGKPLQYSIKVGSATSRDELYDRVSELIPK
ncbi:BA75_04708T0 [Komagataella pastoris]|uniref:BA75_04708T0 n=1 Tax=Komagataella pastoris TaxID=4922 RepID=A0A1B2JHK7_PICPA|nr:BA75_04708T0 [Komagataella pastoris]